MKCNLDQEWLNEKYNLKNCEISGIAFNPTMGPWHTLSIDRIDNKQGYTKQNCKAVLLGLNAGKGEYCTYEELYNIAKSFIAKYEKDHAI